MLCRVSAAANSRQVSVPNRRKMVYPANSAPSAMGMPGFYRAPVCALARIACEAGSGPRSTTGASSVRADIAVARQRVGRDVEAF